ncbi:hypothetical protein H7U32_07550 [Bifidobacterium pullorum subsp. saeculare]|uniref:Uncharacterized protein n=1 Tax=Bifidobacterium pullorum subsp. saeculare TaxID=78257 RepID=A0A938WYF4_9BIFI|nr:hypothetical protein [Bifidobacterium pullorum]MBM6700151.1 hypothetical protein [Bifidobacterium pullorum subsp. saeculare]
MGWFRRLKHDNGYVSPFDVDETKPYIDPGKVLERETKAKNRRRQRDAARQAHQDVAKQRIRQEAKHRRYDDSAAGRRTERAPGRGADVGSARAAVPGPAPTQRRQPADRPSSGGTGHGLSNGRLAVAVVCLVAAVFVGFGSSFLVGIIPLLLAWAFLPRKAGATGGPSRRTRVIVALVTTALIVIVVAASGVTAAVNRLSDGTGRSVSLAERHVTEGTVPRVRERTGTFRLGQRPDAGRVSV